MASRSNCAKPYIGITCDHDKETDRLQLRMAYCRSILNAGGLPVLIPYASSEDMTAILTHVSGLLLSGGGDVDPSLFAESPHPYLGRVNKVRDDVEIWLCKLALSGNIPLLGICRGMQVMNTAMGGSLYQDLNSQWVMRDLLEHNQKAPDNEPVHRVEVSKNTLLHRITGKSSLNVNSLHHQAIKSASYPFYTVAKADDGVTEAIESDKHTFCLGIQWHPERMPDDFVSKSIFSAFVDACYENSKKERFNNA